MKKIALCVGINKYPGGNELTWPVKDAQDWTEFLTSKGFDVTTLLDSQGTRAGIMNHLRDLLAACKSGDSFFFQFSGHGTQIPDITGDDKTGPAPDQYDEAVCCFDLFAEPGIIFDDEFWGIFTGKPEGVKCVAAMDSCHSQTVMRLVNLEPASLGLVRRAIPWEKIPPASRTRVTPREAGPRRPWPVLEIAGCEAAGYSYDASDLKNGAFTYWALKTARALPPKATNNQWFLEIRKHLPSKQYPQTPRMAGSYLNHIAFS